jgi:gas vesicle protein
MVSCPTEEIVMKDEHDARLISFLSGFLFGAAIGAGVGLLVAPGSGRRTRRRIRGAAEDLRELTYERWDELTDDVKERLEQTLKGARSGVARIR